MDAGYKTLWIAKKVLEDGRIPILPYTRYKGKNDKFKPWDFTYIAATDSFTCPRGHELRHTTTSKEGKRTYRSSPKKPQRLSLFCFLYHVFAPFNDEMAVLVLLRSVFFDKLQPAAVT